MRGGPPSAGPERVTPRGVSNPGIARSTGPILRDIRCRYPPRGTDIVPPRTAHAHDSSLVPGRGSKFCLCLGRRVSRDGGIAAQPTRIMQDDPKGVGTCRLSETGMASRLLKNSNTITNGIRCVCPGRPPTVCYSGRGHRTCVGSPRAQRLEGVPARNGHRHVAIRFRAVPELAPFVLAPAIGGTRRR